MDSGTFFFFLHHGYALLWVFLPTPSQPMSSISRRLDLPCPPLFHISEVISTESPPSVLPRAVYWSLKRGDKWGSDRNNEYLSLWMKSLTRMREKPNKCSHVQWLAAFSHSQAHPEGQNESTSRDTISARFKRRVKLGPGIR
ncbi:hypothetical protein K456DRAFT_657237 [Colletotrichum gloeosporioides 23]|nr:hypothetical protein K456DRAFT_657237 [Colletotrichum gloeosporioides 23]